MMNSNKREIIEKAWDDRSLLKNAEVQEIINQTIEDLDKGKIRVAEPGDRGWVVNEWVKKAVILYFPIQKMELIQVPPFEFHDKMDLKSGKNMANHFFVKSSSNWI